MTLNKTIQSVRPAICQIKILMRSYKRRLGKLVPDKFNFQAIGTCFFINNEGYLITANHVIESGNSFLKQRDNLEKKYM